MQERHNSIAYTLELHLFCTYPSIWQFHCIYKNVSCGSSELILCMTLKAFTGVCSWEFAHIPIVFLLHLQGSFCACTRPMRDNVTLSRRLSLAGRTHKMIPVSAILFVVALCSNVTYVSHGCLSKPDADPGDVCCGWRRPMYFSEAYLTGGQTGWATQAAGDQFIVALGHLVCS